ncbi:ammonium transporter [Nitzschia inconspicua]|uniref:Ammonium transporter n=1 Tax=Nitzschia inconspicua TaxID=303405 RepID=A0A9K3L3Y7_9STRA|nr:ammonium transporter [Nitzschia inconspicua]
MQQSLWDSQAAAAAASDIAAGVDAFYLIFAGALVYFMQTGFAMLCAGSIRAKNVKNVILWNLLDSSGGGLAFWAVGWAFAYGGDDDSNKFTFIGNTDFFVSHNSGVPLELWFFQFAFACALSSIVAGTIAERTQMKAYLMYSVFLVGFVYPVVAHALWSTNGIFSKTAAEPLFGSGAIDLAGSGAVHMTGGVAALVGTLILGPRMGRFYDGDGNPLEEPATFTPHSTALQFLGTFCLWFGWYGFNPGSVLVIASEQAGTVAALVVINTTLGACAGAVSAMFFSSWFDWREHGEVSYDVAATMNGCLTGLVAITAGCATVDTWAAVVIGICAGLFYNLGSKLLIRLRIDDAVDAIPVHMVGGAWGMISTGLLSSPELIAQAFSENPNAGWFYEWSRGSGNFTLLGCQLLAVLFIFGWTFATMGFWFGLLNYMGWFRVDPLEEAVGLDVSRHKGPAYEYTAPEDESVNQLMERRDSKRSLNDNSRKGQKAEIEEPEKAVDVTNKDES